ncbi:hypothetical protein HY484_04260 [Candidatus Woesearchaeota archaeon]|nr:hypothetical protein [Candidatus Woesearchaeota archaeon]
MSFDESDKRIKKIGLHRHLRPCESFGLTIDGLEGKLDGDLKCANEDILISYGEWLSLSFERHGKILAAYVDPEGLLLQGNKHVKKDFKFFEEVEFGVSVPSLQLIRLKEFSDVFVKFMYGRIFKDLPEEIQKNARVFLPPDGEMWPVGRGFYFSVFVYYFDNWASRGVVVNAGQKFLNMNILKHEILKNLH